VGFAFGRHCSHLTARADEIAHRHGAWHINSTDLDSTRRGWFECPDRGPEMNAGTATGVLADVEAAGGFDKLRRKRRSMRVNSLDAGRFIGRNVGAPNGDFTYVLDFIGGRDRD
jgi:hypothetical protein